MRLSREYLLQCIERGVTRSLPPWTVIRTPKYRNSAKCGPQLCDINLPNRVPIANLYKQRGLLDR